MASRGASGRALVLLLACLGQLGPQRARAGGSEAATPSLRNNNDTDIMYNRDRALQEEKQVARVCEPMRMGEPPNQNTRTCLRQCQLNEENQVVPDFFDWEAYCVATATDEDWDAECQKFYCCLFGCAVFDDGTGRKACYDASPEDRVDLLNLVQMKNVQKGQRCDAEKCRGFCVRSEFGTCRELQYTRSCKASKLGLYKCDVKCNMARRGVSPWWSGGLAALLAQIAVLSGLALCR